MTEPIQKKLLRIRPPKVKITYDVETGGAVEKKELPFIAGILADLSGDRTISGFVLPFKERLFVDIDRDNLEDIMVGINPAIDLSQIACVLPDPKAGETLSGTLHFGSLEDFNPFEVIKRIPALNVLLVESLRKQMQWEQNEDANAIDVVIKEANAVDAAINAQLNLIMHAPVFKKLEASWRGLNYLVNRTETGPMLKLRLLNVSNVELAEDFAKTENFDECVLFKKIYDAEYGTYGGVPYSLLAGDFFFGNSGSDVSLLTGIAQVAAMAHAPFICGAAASLFGIERFSDFTELKKADKLFEGVEHAAFHKFLCSENARYVSLVVPTIMMRMPYGKDNNITEGFCFEEEMNEGEHCLLGNASYLLAERIANAFSLYGWTAAIRGVEGGGLVEGLPFWNKKDENGAVAILGPASVHITSTLGRQLEELGFVTLNSIKGTSKAAFFSNHDTLTSHTKTSNDPDRNAKISAMLPYILSASRFAHYIKVIMRNKMGSFLTRGNVESFLNTWISNYVLLDDNATAEVKAAYPLRDAKIVVTDVPGSPGAYTATLFLKPHFQLEELSTSMRIVVHLPAG